MGSRGEISAEDMTEPVLHDRWSVKDTIGHVAYYEKWLQRWIEAAVHGKVTVASHRDILDVDQRNALIWDENKNRPLSEISAESKYVYERLYELVRFLPERDLLDQYTYERFIVPFWNRSQPLWQCIVGDSSEHYAEHTANIRRWLDAEKSKLVVGIEWERSSSLPAEPIR
jgi:hypothetical protein